ncbi:MAG: SAF domain-containing protein [Acidimicrobiia bacterium]|nr:SAF domain-containing protein [Acidimicrobiia bacterium]
MRWAAAALLIIGAVVWDLRGSATEPHPFAARPIAAGTPLAAADVAWRRLPASTYAVPDLGGAVAAVDLAAGDPISSSVLAGPVVVPDGWWAIALDVSAHAGTGDEVLLVVIDPPLTLPGIVIEPQVGDATSLNHRPALVAVPGSQAPLVAAAEASGLLVTAVRP